MRGLERLTTLRSGRWRTHVFRSGVPLAVLLVLGVFAGSLGGCSDRACRSTGRQLTAYQGAGHVPTWTYDGCDGGWRAPGRLVRAWVTFAESNCGPGRSKALRDCLGHGPPACTPVQYLDANHIYAVGSVPVARASRPSWWLHQPGTERDPARIRFPTYGGGFDLNQLVGGVRAWFARYVRAHYNAYPALMMDDSSASLSDELWGSGFATSREIRTDSGLEQAHELMAAALRHRDGSPFLQIDNGLRANDNIAPSFPMLDRPTSVVGLLMEGEPMDDGHLTSYYAALLDDLAYVDGTPNDFITLLSYDTAGSPRARRVQEATVLLGYSDSHVVDWAYLATDSSDLQIWPEEGIVPAEPVQTMAPPGGPRCLAGTGVLCSRGGHNDVRVAPGVYAREFGLCYDRGHAFGRCAAIVNTTDHPVIVSGSWLRNSYSYEITFRGGTVESGGGLDLNGSPFSPGASVVPAQDALLLSQPG